MIYICDGFVHFPGFLLGWDVLIGVLWEKLSLNTLWCARLLIPGNTFDSPHSHAQMQLAIFPSVFITMQNVREYELLSPWEALGLGTVH